MAAVVIPLSPSLFLLISTSDGLATSLKSVLLHFKNSQFGGSAKPVFGGPEYPVEIMLVPSNKQHRIHNMFQDLGTGQCAILGDMPDEKNRGGCFFGIFHQLAGTFP